jgi:hypothetical protein
MSFVDVPLYAGALGKAVAGLVLSKTGAMVLEVATGSVVDHNSGDTYTLSSAQDHVFTSDSTHAKRVQILLVENGTTTDIWVDEFLLDDLTRPADIPSGYSMILDLGWFDFEAAETDLDNATIYRREWL